MALYNNGYPITYPQYYPQQYYTQPNQNGGYTNQQMQGSQQYNNQITGQIQNGGFIPVPSEMDARNYPVAPGNSVTFKDEKLPYVYVKTMGFSQLDRPVFEKFRLVKEQDASDGAIDTDTQSPRNTIEYATKEDFTSCRADIESLRSDLSDLGERLEEVSSKKTDGKKRDSNERRKPNTDA